MRAKVVSLKLWKHRIDTLLHSDYSPAGRSFFQEIMWKDAPIAKAYANWLIVSGFYPGTR